MSKITVGLSFADKSLDINDYYEVLSAAVQSASHNLYSRHRYTLTGPMYRDDYNNPYVCLEFGKRPGDVVPANWGYHLRGISKYILQVRPDLKENRIGNRLMVFDRLPNESRNRKYSTEELRILFNKFLLFIESEESKDA